MKIYRTAVIGCGREGSMGPDTQASPHPFNRPRAHAPGSGFVACERTELIACSDPNQELMAAFGEVNGVPEERQYLDYRELIEKEKPDIVAVGTQRDPRVEMAIYAAEHGVPAIYAEKHFAPSLSEADALVEAVERNGVAFNMGTRRRWYSGFDKMKEIIDGGDLGSLKSLVVRRVPSLFGHGCHVLDLTLRLNSDQPVSWVQAHLPDGDSAIQGDVLVEDPRDYHGVVQFENDVTAYVVLTPHAGQYEAICEGGVVEALNDWRDFRLSLRRDGGPELVSQGFPEFEPASPTVRLIEDLVHALDTGQPTRQGARVARAGAEVLFAFVVSHMRGGERVELPLKDCNLRRPDPPNPAVPR